VEEEEEELDKPDNGHSCGRGRNMLPGEETEYEWGKQETRKEEI
jgi:hypothetical protein